MELADIRSCFVTGGASGIGAGVARALAARGVAVTLADVDDAGGSATAQSLVASGCADVQYVRCDVTDPEQLRRALDRHWARFGGCDAAFLNAGIEETTSFLDEEEGKNAWRRVLVRGLSHRRSAAELQADVPLSQDIDFTAVAEGVRQLVRRWRGASARGVVVVTSSAAGLYPVPGGEVYAAAKGACVQLVRSLAHLAPAVRVCALCPAYADTQMVARMREKLAGVHVMPLQNVVDAAMQCFGDSGNAGKCLFVAPGMRRPRYWTFPGDDVAAARPVPAPRQRDHSLVAWALLPLPSTQQVVRVHTLTADFSKATQVDTLPLSRSPKLGHVLVRRLFAGINASDINFTSGRYFGSPKIAAAKLPFAAGFETVGVVVAAAPDVKHLAVGDVVGSLSYGGFAEYGEESAKTLLPGMPPTPQAVALLTSGLTASIALEQAARLKPTDVVLVTAAAGGTGQFAVQLAAQAGCVVIATCGGRAKADLLRRLGATRIIDHTAEDVRAVLKAEYPRGVDVVYESVGGDMFDTCLNALAPKGRLVVIGAMSRYASGWAPAQTQGSAPPPVPDVLLWKGASCVGFFLPMHAHHFRRHLAALVAMLDAGRLQVAVDASRFVGLEAAAAAVARLQGGKSVGKVVLQIPRDLPPSLTPARL